MKLTFWGAARQVTGSMYLLELEDDYRILIDCGFDMDRERGKEDPLPQAFPGSVFPFDASRINLVLLTHAHIDHSGNIPNLYREGYEGQVLCTSPTIDLTHLLLMDSALLHRRRLQHLARMKKKNNLPPPNVVNEWYLEKQVSEAIDNFVGIAFNQRFRVKKGLEITFIPAGHLLGAANILIEVSQGNKRRRILFSGDIGRRNYPLLPDPDPVPQADYLICESTYGDRIHTPHLEVETELEKAIYETCVEKPGRLIIPSFSVGRTQSLLYTFNKLAMQKRLPPIKIFSDSPMALQSTRIYTRYSRMLNEEARQFMDAHDTLFDFDNLVIVEDLKKSKEISNYREPCIIISSSGMLEGGRIQHHIKHNLANPYCTILMVGYSAENTLGRQLLEGIPSLRLGNKEIPVLAKIKYTDAFSGHGDQNDLINFVKQQSPEQLKHLFLVHGEIEAMETFKNALHAEGYRSITIPERGQTFALE
ncbi:MAG: MBL fold metallo-hydrolase [Cytophagales bacterium]|nr:MBL fold metallo-hydrolase [Bernardetiaceae bacterium]MDW8210492.1 MBL fold metallo-hydrolase [Cytophagales bacterium]